MLEEICDKISNSDKSEHIDCFTLTVTESNQFHRWIKHYKSNEILSSQNYLCSRNFVQLNKDILVKKGQHNDGLLFLLKNSEHNDYTIDSSKCYTFDKEFAQSKSLNEGIHNNNDLKKECKINNDIKSKINNDEKTFIKSSKPPPVPPKPKNLPHVNDKINQNLFKFVCKYDKQASVCPSDNNLKLTKFDKLKENSESENNAKNLKNTELYPSCSDSEMKNGKSLIISKKDDENEQDDLDYHVSICSMSELCNNVSQLNYELEKIPKDFIISKENVKNNDHLCNINKDLMSNVLNNPFNISNICSSKVDKHDNINDICTKANGKSTNENMNFVKKEFCYSDVIKLSKNLDNNNENCEVFGEEHYERIEQIDDSLNESFLNNNNFNSNFNHNLRLLSPSIENFVEENVSNDVKLLHEKSLLILVANSVDVYKSSSNINHTNNESSKTLLNLISSISSPDVMLNTDMYGENVSEILNSMSQQSKSDAEVCINSVDNLKTPDNTIKISLNLSLVYDKDGDAVFVPSKYLTKYKDHTSEPWFYPMELSPHQASLFLESTKQQGCFLVYKPKREIGRNVLYVLSVLSTLEESVLHYNIIENLFGDYSIENHPYSFLTICDLVDYFQHNKSFLAVRLRRPLKYSQLPITAGIHYEPSLEIPKQQIYLTGEIVCKSDLTEVVTCVGKLRSATSENFSSSEISLIAVKVLQSNNTFPYTDDDFVEEANILAGLNHENILKLLGVSFRVKPLFMVTELFPRKSLRDVLISREIGHRISILFSLCLQVISAMAYLEGKKYIIIRNLSSRSFAFFDISSSVNCSCSYNYLIKLCDFSRARKVSDDCYQGELSESLKVKICSPEVLNSLNYSTKSDVWSSALILWEIFGEGLRPYYGMTPAQVIVFIMEGGLLDKPPLCPQDLFPIISKCWKPLPKNRPSFEQIKNQLAGKSEIYFYSQQNGKHNSHNSHLSFSEQNDKLQDGTHVINNQLKTPLLSAQPTLSKENLSKTPPLPTNSKRLNCANINYPELPKSPSENSIFKCQLPSPEKQNNEVDAIDTIARSNKLRKSLQKIMKINKPQN